MSFGGPLLHGFSLEIQGQRRYYDRPKIRLFVNRPDLRRAPEIFRNFYRGFDSAMRFRDHAGELTVNPLTRQYQRPRETGIFRNRNPKMMIPIIQQ
jgi:hypothetical protein